MTWGDADCDSSRVQDRLKGVQQVRATIVSAFAALLADGSVVTWGDPDCGGDSSDVQDRLKGVQQAQASHGAFSAILADGSVVTCSDEHSGGDSSAVAGQFAVVAKVSLQPRIRQCFELLPIQLIDGHRGHRSI